MQLKTYLDLPEVVATEVARRAGMTRQALSMIANGSRNPSLSAARRIRDATQGLVTLDDLADGSKAATA